MNMDNKKPNDMFALVAGTPDANVFDLAVSNVDLKNTQLLDKDHYKSLPKVKELFKTEDGGFDNVAFDQYYSRAAQLINELGNDKHLRNAIAYDPYDFTKPIGSKDVDVSAKVTKDFNPFLNTYSRTGINSIDSSKLSLREIAQQGKIFDVKENKWLEESANDKGLFGSMFGETLVYAQWDEDGEHINPVTKLKSKHKKGDWKYDEDGNLFTETLAGREVFNKQVVNPMDLITTEGSTFNKLDFFDSDGRNKSVIGTTAKLAAEIAPFLIPGVNTVYGGFKMALGLATVLPTFYKAFEGILLGDTTTNNETDAWKAMNSMQGFLSKYSQNSTSDEARGSMFNYEQIANLTSDVFSQIYEQRAAASLSKLVYKLNKPEYLSKLESVAQKELVTGVLGKSIKDETAEGIATKAMMKVSEIESKRSQLAKKLSLSYMALTQSADVFGEAINSGYDRRSAGIAALLAAGGQYGLMMNNRMGTWFLDKTTGYSEDISTAGIKKVLKSKMDEIQDAVKQFSTNEVVGKQKLAGIFTSVKTGFSNLIKELPEAGEGIWKNAMVEGVEEATEQAAIDMAKGVVDTMSWLGLTKKEGSFGGFSNVLSQEGLMRYVENIVGGAIGGGLFEIHGRMIAKNINPETENDLIRLIANGQKDKLLKIIDSEKSNYGSDELSPIATKIGDKEYYLTKTNISQADVIANATKEYIEGIDRMLNINNLKHTDEELIRKTIRDEIVINDMKANKTDSFIIREFQDLTNNIKSISDQIATFKEEVPTKLTSKLSELQDKVEALLKGEYSEYFHGLSLFALNDKLHGMFTSLNLEDYVKSKYGQNLSELDDDTKKLRQEEFNEILEDTTYKSVKAKYDVFNSMVSEFSPSIKEYETSGYSDLRRNFYKTLRDANKRSLLDILKSVQNIDGVNKATYDGVTVLKDQDVKSLLGIGQKLNLSTNIDISVGDFIVNNLNAVQTNDENRDNIIQKIDSLGTQQQLMLSDYNMQGDVSNLIKLINSPFEEKIKLLQDKLSTATPEEAIQIDSEISELSKELIEMSPTFKRTAFPQLDLILDYANTQAELDNDVVEDLIDIRDQIFQRIGEIRQSMPFTQWFGENEYNDDSKLSMEEEFPKLYEYITSPWIKTEEVYYDLSKKEQQLLEELVKEFGNESLSKIQEIDKVLDKDRKINTLYEKLAQFQIMLFGGNQDLSVFSILKDNIDKFNKITMPSEFMRNDLEIAQINKSIDTLNAIDAVAIAMLTTDVGTSNPYGYNILMQTASDKLGTGLKYEFINKESYSVIKNDLQLIRNKLNFLKGLAENNSGSEIEIQDKIDKATTSILISKLTNSNSALSALNLKIGEKHLLTIDDIPSDESLSEEEVLMEICDKMYTNFQNMEKGSMKDAIGELFAPFSSDPKFLNLLDVGKNTLLTTDIKDIEFRDYYYFIGTVLSSKIKNFYLDYKKLIEKEVSLDKNKAPFYVQKLVLQQTYSYLQNKEILSEMTLLAQPEFENFNNKPTTMPLSNIFFVKGSGGTGKSSVIGNFLLRMVNGNPTIVGESPNIILSAPTEKTLTILGDSIDRANDATKTKYTKEELLKSLFISGDNYYSTFIKELDEIKELAKVGKNRENKNDNVLLVGNVSDNDILVKSEITAHFKNVEKPTIILIDEIGRFTPMELQILNHFAKHNPSVRIIGMGDEFQNGETMNVLENEISYSLENTLMPQSIKMKSPIRSDNKHSSDNITSIESWVELNVLKLYLDADIAQKINIEQPTLTYYDRDFIYGHKFSETLLEQDLAKLNTKKKIVFITDEKGLTEEQSEIIKKALGWNTIPDDVVFKNDVQGEEFDQVVILKDLKKKDVLKLSEIKDIYTLFSRAKIATLIVGNTDLLSDFKNVASDINNEKLLNESAIQNSLTQMLERLEYLTANFKEVVDKPKEIAKEELENTGIKVLDYEQEKQQTIDNELVQNVITENTEVKNDKKVLAYTFFNNVGINSTIGDISDKNWKYQFNGKTIDVNTVLSNQDLQNLFIELKQYSTGTDLFALHIPDAYFAKLTDVTLHKVLSDYVEFKNSLLFNKTINLTISNPFGLQRIIPKFEIRKLSDYSQPIGKLVNKQQVLNSQFFAGYIVDGVFISTIALPDVNNGEVKNAIGDESFENYLKFLNGIESGKKVNELKFYKNLKEYLPTVIPGDKNKDASDPTKDFPKFNNDGFSLDELQNLYFGVTFSEVIPGTDSIIRVFRGGTKEDFVTHIKATLSENGVKLNPNTDYTKLFFRPYIIINFAKGTKKHSRLMTLSAKKRSLSTLLDEFENPIGETAEEEADYRSSLVSRYDAFKILSDYFKYLKKNSLYEEKIIKDITKQAVLQTYGNSDQGLYFQTLLKLVENEVNFGKLVQDNPVFKNYIVGNKAGLDIFGTKLMNPMYIINVLKYKLPNWDSFVNDYDSGKDDLYKPIYYNTKIMRISQGTELEGYLPKSTYKNYVLHYAVEPPQYLLDLENINDLFDETETKQEVIFKESLDETSESVLDKWLFEITNNNDFEKSLEVSLDEKESFIINGEQIKQLFNSFIENLPDLEYEEEFKKEFTKTISDYIKTVYSFTSTTIVENGIIQSTSVPPNTNINNYFNFVGKTIVKGNTIVSGIVKTIYSPKTGKFKITIKSNVPESGILEPKTCSII